MATEDMTDEGPLAGWLYSACGLRVVGIRFYGCIIVIQFERYRLLQADVFEPLDDEATLSMRRKLWQHVGSKLSGVMFTLDRVALFFESGDPIVLRAGSLQHSGRDITDEEMDRSRVEVRRLLKDSKARPNRW